MTATLPSRRSTESENDDFDFDGPASLPTVLVDINEFIPEVEHPTALPAPPLVPFLDTFEPRIPQSAIPTGINAPACPPTLRVAPARRHHLYLVRGARESGPPSAPPTAPARRFVRLANAA